MVKIEQIPRSAQNDKLLRGFALGRGLVSSRAANQPPPQSSFNRNALSF